MKWSNSKWAAWGSPTEPRSLSEALQHTGCEFLSCWWHLRRAVEILIWSQLSTTTRHEFWILDSRKGLKLVFLGIIYSKKIKSTKTAVPRMFVTWRLAKSVYWMSVWRMSVCWEWGHLLQKKRRKYAKATSRLQKLKKRLQMEKSKRCCFHFIN